ncbi:hypothetical protein Vretimale_4712 [Volvox reticuliferus]|uniref:Uncharacterized protein n=1 Tax=Volvox reticuliferus TaxID=1737510 RepID=A0A8J4G4H2_9CHLO|nr:hypothetical protein Vretifemale_3315 [Volvox reticuliferus]GIL99576.1 hypothetical protein Vretimale_4712 [Volvox reticuliferus]
MPLSSGAARRMKALSPIPTPRADDAMAEVRSTEQPTVFKLQLRPLEDPESFKPSVQLVSREFATRYLESVGVRPSKATMDLVNRNVPLTEAHIKTTLRAKGHVEDEIHISVPPVTHRYRVPAVINPAAVLQLGIGNSVLGSGTEKAGDAEGGPGSSESLEELFNGRPGDATAASRAPGGTDFLDMATKYLHPFNLDLTLARKSLTTIHAASRYKSPQGGGGDGDSPLVGGAAGGSGIAGIGGSSFGTSTSGRGGTAGLLEGRGGALSSRSSFAASSRRSGSWPRSSSGRLLDDGGVGVGALDATRLEVLEELTQPLLVTPEVVLTLQAQLEAALADWHRHQAPEALKGRLTTEEFNRTQEELSSEGMAKLLITLINFLHEELVRGHPSYPAQLSNARENSRTSVLPGERSSQPRSIGGSGDGGGGGSGGGGLTGRRSHAGSVTFKGGVQLPASISIQQMTNLQKYDLGYQAYVRQKLEQRQAQGTAASNTTSRGDGVDNRSQLNTPPDTRGSTRAAGFGSAGDRPTAMSAVTQPQQQQSRPQSQSQSQSQPQSHQLHRHHPTTADTQRVSFAVTPLCSSLPGSPQADSRPASPGPRGGSNATSLLGTLNLPTTSRSRPNSSHPTTPGTASRNQRSASPANTPNAGASGFEATDPGLSSPLILGLPPHVGRALRSSPSFALASAANTARSIHASLDAEDMAALQRERLFALHIDFASRFKALRQKRSGMFFTLPILLLSMRLCVNLLFSTLYPLWTRQPDGAEVLEQMDEALCALFDPHGYLQRALSLLQSTPSAIEAVTRHPQRRGNERRHFNDTSPLMQATLQGPKSAGARKLMKAAANQPQGLDLMRTQLTTEQRAALFQMGLQWMQQPDPVLSQVGEPHAVGRL